MSITLLFFEIDISRIVCTLYNGTPDEECGGHKHNCQVDSHSCLKVELLEECCSIADAKEKEGRKIGC